MFKHKVAINFMIFPQPFNPSIIQPTGTLHPPPLTDMHPPGQASHVSQFTIFDPILLAKLVGGVVLLKLGWWTTKNRVLRYKIDRAYQAIPDIPEKRAVLDKGVALLGNSDYAAFHPNDGEEVILHFLRQASELGYQDIKELAEIIGRSSENFLECSLKCRWSSGQIKAFAISLIDRAHRGLPFYSTFPTSNGVHYQFDVYQVSGKIRWNYSHWSRDETFNYVQELTANPDPDINPYERATYFLECFSGSHVSYTTFRNEVERYGDSPTIILFIRGLYIGGLLPQLKERDLEELLAEIPKQPGHLSLHKIIFLEKKAAMSLGQFGQYGREPLRRWSREQIRALIVATVNRAYRGLSTSFNSLFLEGISWSGDELFHFMQELAADPDPEKNPYQEASILLKALPDTWGDYARLQTTLRPYRVYSPKNYIALAYSDRKIRLAFSKSNRTEEKFEEISAEFLRQAVQLPSTRIISFGDEVASSLVYLEGGPFHWSPEQIKTFIISLIGRTHHQFDPDSHELLPYVLGALFKEKTKELEQPWSGDDLFDYLQELVTKPDPERNSYQKAHNFIRAFEGHPVTYAIFREDEKLCRSYNSKNPASLARCSSILQEGFSNLAPQLTGQDHQELITYFLVQVSSLPEELGIKPRKIAEDIVQMLFLLPKKPLCEWSRVQVVAFVKAFIDGTWRGRAELRDPARPVSIFMKLLSSRKPLWSAEEILDFMQTLATHNRRYLAPYKLAHALLASLDDESMSWEHLKFFLNKINNTNEETMIQTIRNFVVPCLWSLKDERDKLTAWKLFISLFKEYPHEGLRIAQDLFQNMKSAAPDRIQWHLLDKAGRDQVLDFIDITRFFDLRLFQAWRKNPDMLRQSLRDVHDATQRDQLTEEMIRQLRENYGDVTAMRILRLTVPASSASMVDANELVQYMISRQALGDRSDQVPAAWKTLRETEDVVFSLNQGTYVQKEKTTIDPEGRLERWVPHLLQDETRDTTTEHLSNLLLAYLYDPGETTQGALWDGLLGCVGKRGNIDLRAESTYRRLQILENIFTDKDEVKKELARALDAALPKMDWGKIKLKKEEQGIANIASVASNLDAVWQKTPADEALLISANILARFDARDFPLLVAKVAHKEARVYLDDIIRGQQSLKRPSLEAKDVKNWVHSGVIELVLAWIKNEKTKFEFEGMTPVRLRLRAVKGLAYAHWTTGAGVCVYEDTYHWKDPDFVLLTPTIEFPRGSFVPFRSEGFIATKVAVINGEKYLTLPGFNPSIELMNMAKPSEILVRLMNRVRRYARVMGCEAILIPTTTNISSNRSEINTEIKRRYGNKTKTWTSPVKWHSSGYNFDTAYEVALEEEKEPPVFYPQEAA